MSSNSLSVVLMGLTGATCDVTCSQDDYLDVLFPKWREEHGDVDTKGRLFWIVDPKSKSRFPMLGTTKMRDLGYESGEEVKLFYGWQFSDSVHGIGEHFFTMVNKMEPEDLSRDVSIDTPLVFQVDDYNRQESVIELFEIGDQGVEKVKGQVDKEGVFVPHEPLKPSTHYHMVASVENGDRLYTDGRMTVKFWTAE